MGTHTPLLSLLLQADFKRSLSREGTSMSAARAVQIHRVDAMLATMATGDAALIVGGDVTVGVAEVRVKEDMLQGDVC